MCWGCSAHWTPLSPEVTGPGLGRGARVNGSPWGQGPSAAGVPLPGAGPLAPCPVLGQQPRPLLPRRVKRKQGGGGSQPAASWGLCPDPRPRTDRGQGHRLRGPSHVLPGPNVGPPRVRPSPAQHSTERRGQLSRTRSSGLTAPAPPGLPPAPRPLLPGRLPASVHPFVRGLPDSQAHC